MRHTRISTRTALLCAASAVGLVAAPANAQSAEDAPAIITTDGVSHLATVANGGSLDSGITGVGQMSVSASPTTTGFTSCTGSLVNPRTVIFAAHCVNSRPMEAYGKNGISFGAHTATGTPIAFGFEANNLPAIRQWFGLASAPGGTDANPALRYNSNLARALYAVEQVWYDTRSLEADSLGFLKADIAIATLDTPAFDIPTWAMLFSPLDGPVEATMLGYGIANTATAAEGTPGCVSPNCGPAASSDFRRRIAKNILSVLGSLYDRNLWIYDSGVLTGNINYSDANVYMMSFSSPLDENGDPSHPFDFGIFGGPSRGDTPLAQEGITASGDSGGPLVVNVDGKTVTVGVLSGGSRFYIDEGQRFSTLGTHNFYQPLHVYWDKFVENNSYVYAGNKAGDGNWEDGAHWVQQMDPNYMILSGGNVVNGLPDTVAEGTSGVGAQFGYFCGRLDENDDFDPDNCTNIAQAAPTGNGTPVFIAGGPGSTDFVPNNVVANPKLGIKSRYYDVTLAASGKTSLSSAVTIDRMTLDGQTALNVNANGSLNVLGEYNQLQGWTNVDGSITTGRDMFLLSGLLSGKGTVNADYLTAVSAIVAPGGGDKVGTLTVNGNVILSADSSLFIDARRGSADELKVVGSEGTLALDGGNVVFNKVTDAPAPRLNEKYVIASATGGIDGTFGEVFTFQGVLRPELSYTENTVTATLRAGSLVTVLESGTPQAIAFASALDALRTNNYTSLFNLYGSIDWMNGAQLASTFDAMTPRILGDVGSFHDYQSRKLTGAVTDRLSILGSGKASGLTLAGSPVAALAENNGDGVRFSYSTANTSSTVIDSLPGNLTGFVSGGVERTRSSYGDRYAAGQGAWHMASGLEMPLGDGRIGTAAGYAEGASSPGNDSNRSRTTMAAAYASMPVGNGFYVGGVLSAETARTTMDRSSYDGVTALRLSGATSASRYSAVAEAGRVTDIGAGLSVTPRAQLAYGRYTLNGFEERGGETALQVDDITVNRLEARVGAKLEGEARFAGFSIKPQISADYVNLVSGRDRGALVRFAAAPEHAIALPLTSGAGSWAEIKGGVMFGDGPVTLGLSGQQTVGAAELSDQRAQAEFKFRF